MVELRNELQINTQKQGPELPSGNWRPEEFKMANLLNPLRDRHGAKRFLPTTRPESVIVPSSRYSSCNYKWLDRGRGDRLCEESTLNRLP
jgi:hypothetical protein